MKKRLSPQILTFMALSVVINFAGALLALIFRLPIYLDSIGTIMSGILLGPLGGGVVGALTALINGMTFDPVSIYFLPVYIFTGMATGLLFHGKQFSGIKSVLEILLIGILVSLISSLIVSMVFDGVTSSGSSIIVAFLANIGVPKILAILSTQIVTDVCDKFIAFGLAFSAIKLIPKPYLYKLGQKNN